MKKNEDNFNPVKEMQGNKRAERVIWTTEIINLALQAIEQGKPLKASPFYMKNTKLLKPELVYRRTKEEIEDYIKCKTDPVYFASKCFLMTPEGLQACKLRDYQIDYLHHLQNNRFSILLAARQSGKSTTTAIYCLWVVLFNSDKSGLILSKSGPAGVDLIKKIKDMYLYLPYHLKIGTMKWNQGELSFDNNSSISTESFSPTAGLGKTINFLILDEFAWCPPNDVELFYNNIIPTVTTITDSNVCIMSTQNGFNLFYKIWKAAIEKRSMYAPFKIDWYQVPQFNQKTKQWDKRTEKWKQEMIGILGSEEAFYYQYGTQFSASDKCLVSRECLAKMRDKAILWEPRNEDIEEAGISLHLQHPEFLVWDPEFNFKDIYTGTFFILCDLAEGGGGDSTVFNIFKLIEKDKFRHVGRWSSNNVDLEKAALEFWLICSQLFNNERCAISIEWNTYGALFYQLISNYNESEYDMSTSWRFNISPELDIAIIIRYKKQSIEDEAAYGVSTTSKTVPGYKFTSSTKPTACSLLKIMFEKCQIETTDQLTLGELENFEDKNGNGSYKASFGHDDSIMTFCQIPMLMKTARYNAMIEEFEAQNISSNIGSKWETQMNDDYFSYTDIMNKFNLSYNNNYTNDFQLSNY